MYFNSTAHFYGIALSALKHYALPMDTKIKLIRFSENATYLIYDGIKPLGTLRISRPGYRTEKELISETEWIIYLRKTGIEAAEPIRGLDGRFVQSVTDRGGRQYFCIMFHYFYGQHLGQESGGRLIRHFRELGRITARIHQTTENWEGTERIDRPSWNYDTIIGKTPAWGRWQAAYSDKKSIELLSAAANAIHARLDDYGITRGNFGLIHSDMRFANLIIDNDVIQIIDFDDCGFGWHMYDLAAALSFIETSEHLQDYIDAWLEGYSSLRTVTDADTAIISSLIMMRRMQLTAWTSSRWDSDPVKGLSDFAGGTLRLAEKYLDRL